MLVSGEGSKTSEVMQRKGAVPICGVLARRGVRNVQLWNRHALISAVTYCYGQAPYIAVGYCYGDIWFVTWRKIRIRISLPCAELVSFDHTVME